MQDNGFIIADKERRFTLKGGLLWKSPARKSDWQANLEGKKLIMTFRPEDRYEEVFESLSQTIKELSPILSLRLRVSSLLTPFVLIIPAIILIFFIGTVGAYGNLINELISLGEGDTQLGISKWQLFYIQTTIYIVGAYSFPLFFQGDYDDTISRFKKLTDNDEVMRGRVYRALTLLQKRGYLNHLEVWNPNLVSPSNEWVPKILLPGIIDSKVPLTLFVKVEEQFVARNLIEKLAKKTFSWQDLGDDPDFSANRPIPLEYLDTWEREMWQVFAASSTVNLPPEWNDSHANNEQGEGAFKEVISLSMARKIVEQFRNRLFSTSQEEHLSSVNLFVGRCLNDYGLLFPLNAREFSMYRASPGLLSIEIPLLEQERSYIFSFLQRNAGKLTEEIDDVAGLIILAGTQNQESIYNDSKRQVVEAFIREAALGEHFKALRHYWDKVIMETGATSLEACEIELFRLIPVQLLQDLVLAFRRAGMYDKTGLCYRFLQAIYPVNSSIGEAVVLSELGKYKASVEKFLEIEAEWMGDLSGKGKGKGVGTADKHDRLSLNLFMCVVIVMNQLKDYKALAEQSLELISQFLGQMKDGERDNHQLTRYYNVLASYHEWNGDFQQAVDTYEKGLSIPGVDRALISSLMVNKGIAYRFLGKSGNDPETIFSNLREGIRFNGEGVHVKALIGNEDQLPIALHNLAETCIELAHRLAPGEERQNYFEQGLRHSQEGLDINKRIGSHKKKAQLLTERYLACQGLEASGIPASMDRHLIQQELAQWVLENEAKEGYDVDVVMDLLTRIGGLEGDTLSKIKLSLSV